MRACMPPLSMFWIASGLAGFLIDRIDADRVLAAFPHRLAIDVRRPARAIADVNEPSVRMNVNGAGHLRRLARRRVVERVFRKERALARSTRRCSAVDLQLVLPFEIQVHERLRRMEVEMTRLIIRSRHSARSTAGWSRCRSL